MSEMKEKSENIENRLGNLRKDNPFRVPENYFETFPERLNASIAKEKHVGKHWCLFDSFKPLLKIAAIFLLIMLLVYIPYKKYFYSHRESIAQIKSGRNSDDLTNTIPGVLISNFSEEQFLSAYTDMEVLDTCVITSENLGYYIAANYNEYEILTNN